MTTEQPENFFSLSGWRNPRYKLHVRVVIVSWRDLANPQSGGSEVVIHRLALELQRAGHEVALVCGGPIGPRPYPVVESGGVYSQYLKAPLIVLKHYRDWDVLLDVENGIPFFSPIWWRGPRICLVHHVHTDQWQTKFGTLGTLLGKFLESVLMPRIYSRTQFVAISQSTKSALAKIGISEEQIEVIHSGVDIVDSQDSGIVGEWGAIKSKDPIFVVMGRLVPHKRTHLILEAWDEVSKSVRGELLVVGDGPERESLEKLAGDRVRFLGRVDLSERNKLLGKSWMLVHGAHHEGWGLVIIEAAYFRTPTLAYKAEGVSEAVIDGQTGVLVSNQEDLISTWIYLANNPQELGRLGANAEERSREFTWRRSGQKFEDLLRKVNGNE